MRRHIEPLCMINRPSSKASGPDLETQQRQFEHEEDIVRQHAAYQNKPEYKGKAPYRMREVFTSRVRKQKP